MKTPQLSELKLADKIHKINALDVSKPNDDMFCEVKKLLDEVKVSQLRTNLTKSLLWKRKISYNF